jgi:hypothetical protein
VGDPNRGLGLVDVLTSRATGAERVDPQVGRRDVDGDGLIDHGKDEHRGERGVSPLRRVIRRDADEPMNAALGLEVSVGVIAGDLDDRVLDAGFSPGWRSSTLAVYPWRSAHRMYMRNSICAQSCDSVRPRRDEWRPALRGDHTHPRAGS